MGDCKISVIIPVYNVEKFLERCLNSVFMQTFQDYEVICVNDCTPDNSLHILEEFKEKHPDNMIIVNNPENRGLGATRDHGMRYAKGKYIVFIDSDDYIKPDYLMTYYTKIIEGDYDLVTGGYTIVRGAKNQDMNKNPDRYSSWLWPSAWAKMYKKSFLLDNNLDFRGIRIYEDEPFNYRVMFKSPMVSSVNYCGYYYVLNSNSITQSKNTNRVNKFYTYSESIQKLVEEANTLKLNKSDHDIFEFSIMSGLIANALFNGKSSGSAEMKNVHARCFELMEKNFPGYINNPFFRLLKLPKAEFKKRYCTWLIVLLRRIHVDLFMFRLIGRIK